MYRRTPESYPWTLVSLSGLTPNKNNKIQSRFDGTSKVRSVFRFLMDAVLHFCFLLSRFFTFPLISCYGFGRLSCARLRPKHKQCTDACGNFLLPFYYEKKKEGEEPWRTHLSIHRRRISGKYQNLSTRNLYHAFRFCESLGRFASLF